MILFRNFSATVTATEGSILTLVGQQLNGVVITLENKDPLNYVTYRFQSSQSNVANSYANIEEDATNIAPSGTLIPNGQAMVTLHTTAPFIRLLAVSSGGALLEVGLLQFGPNGTATFTSGTI
jgi:hypothetical protein